MTPEIKMAIFSLVTAAARKNEQQDIPDLKVEIAPAKTSPCSEPCGEPCHWPSSPSNSVTMELATVNDDNPCGDGGLDAVCPPVAIDGTDSEKWRRRESNPAFHSTARV